MLFSSFPSVIPYLLTLWILYLTPFFQLLVLYPLRSLNFLLHHLSSFFRCHTPLCFFIFCLSLLHCSLSPHLIFTSPASRLSLYPCPYAAIFPSAPSCHPIFPLCLPLLGPTSAQEMRTRMTQGKKGFLPVLTTSCTSWLSSGRSCLLVFLPRTTWMAGRVSPSLSL